MAASSRRKKRTVVRSRDGAGNVRAAPTAPRLQAVDTLTSLWLVPGQIRRFSNCIFNAKPRISLVKTSKLAGVPASRVFSPFTIDS